MPFQPVPGNVKVEAQFMLDGQNIENVYNVHVGPNPTLADLQQVAGVFNVGISADLMPSMSSALVFVGIKVTDLSVEDGLQFLLATTPPQPGTVQLDAAPNNVAICVTLNTGRSGKGQTGRNYYSGLPEVAYNGSRLRTDYMGIMTAFMNNIIAALEDANYYLALVHRVVNGIELVQGTWDAILSASMRDNVADSQRRRLPGRGR